LILVRAIANPRPARNGRGPALQNVVVWTQTVAPQKAKAIVWHRTQLSTDAKFQFYPVIDFVDHAVILATDIEFLCRPVLAVEFLCRGGFLCKASAAHKAAANLAFVGKAGGPQKSPAESSPFPGTTLRRKVRRKNLSSQLARTSPVATN
jgi:hypothetical protein